ncbi:MAG: hypothetical protein ABID09_04670 [Candidatus Omnitrophota bacterium]
MTGYNRKIAILLLGLILGIALTLSPGILFICALFSISFYCIKRYTHTGSGDFLARLFVFGFAVRAVLAIVNYYFGLTGAWQAADTQPDAIIYNSNAFYIASVLKGANFISQFIKDPFLADKLKMSYDIYKGVIPLPGEYQFGIYVNLLGVLYAWIGYAPIAAKLLNSLFGALGAILVYFIARKLVKSEITAKVSSGIVMFFPSIIFWSVTLLQDTVVNFLFLVYILFVLVYFKQNKKSSLFIAIISLFFLSLLKTKAAILFLIGFILVLLIKCLKDFLDRKNLAKSILLILLYAVLINRLMFSLPTIAGSLKEGITAMFDHHISFENSSSAETFRIYKEAVYEKGSVGMDLNDFLDIGLAYSCFKALAYYLYSPFLWDIPYGHPLLAIFYPQAILTFLTFPFMLLGILISMRRDFLISTAIVLVLTTLMIPQAMAEGLIGNVVRHRDMFMPFIIIYSCYGFCVIMLGKEKTHKLLRQ